MSWTRRDWLRGAGAGGLLSAMGLPLVGCGSQNKKNAEQVPAASDVAGNKVPRYFVLIWVRGGFDAVLTTNPKTRRDVEKSIDIPYSANDIFEVGGIPYGPHLRPMERWLGRASILNNGITGSLAHFTGEKLITRLRTRISRSTPTLFECIGWHRQDQPLGAVAIGQTSDFMTPEVLASTSGRGKPDLIDYLETIPHDELIQAAEGLESFDKGPDGRFKVAAGNAKDVASFLRRLTKVAPMQYSDWMPETTEEDWVMGFDRFPSAGPATRGFQRLLWLLENDLTRTVFYRPPMLDWDSHMINADWQGKMNRIMWPLVARFFDELDKRENKYGKLSEQTTVVFTSELGRHPRLNDHGGKDHFPETPFMFFGPNVRTGSEDGTVGAVWGGTGKRLEALPIDPRTGRPKTDGMKVTMGDVGASILKAYGIQPEVYGYTGRQLPFLFS